MSKAESKAPKATEIRAIKGTRDLVAPEVLLFQEVEAQAREVFRRYGFEEIRTPILEPTELFARAVGEETDIVGKEMFTFLDRDERPICLRPEATASVARAYVEHRLWERPGTTKLYYQGPMFRRERPQKGRYRQFSQIGAEVLGSGLPQVDYELLEMLWTLLRGCGLGDAELLLNSIGCEADRRRYTEALRAALRPDIERMCADCRRRYERNPLRVLDCKVEADQPIIAALPTMLDYLDEPCRAHFSAVRGMLDEQGLPYRLAPRLVRGLDYYRRTAFEFVHGALGAQNALLGGGRYDGLAQALGAPAQYSEGIGFALGEDRFVIAMQAAGRASPARGIAAYIAALGPELLPRALRLARELREAGLAVEVGDAQRKLARQLELAARMGARSAVILGPDEVAREEATLRELGTGNQRAVALAALAGELARPAETKR